MMKERLERDIRDALSTLGVDPALPFSVEYPSDLMHGDYATNAALIASRTTGKNPRVLGEEIAATLKAKNDPDIAEISVAGPGFINFTLSSTFIARTIDEALKGGEWGKNDELAGKKAIVEYTDPNPFKEFHIGHLMSNTIGESISRLIEACGADVRRACYQGDVGLHVAKAVWGKMHVPNQSWGAAYALGATEFERNDEVKKEIIGINKKLYARSDEALNALYDEGRRASLEYFETMYARLGTRFDWYFFESATGEFGKKIVQQHPDIFEQSNGAIVYKGDESRGLHTRVFINRDGLPTYEAKELGLAKIKYDTYPYDISIVITANEVNDYFKVLLDALSKIYPDLARRTEHYAHGTLRLPSGKMSSRTGEVITAVSLLDKAKEEIVAKVPGITNDVAEAAAVAAVKYSILRQAAGRDVIFDFDQSISFDGDSGPYLQYTHARARSVLERAGDNPLTTEGLFADTVTRLVARFPEIVQRAARQRAPHQVANYLIELARAFNSYYGNTPILDGAPDQPQKLALTKAVAETLESGLRLLGIPSPCKM